MPDGRESGEVKGASSELVPPGFGAGIVKSAAETSLWVAAALMLLAALAGYATPALRDRLRDLGRESRTS
jgi:hypothetical protein